LAACSAPLAQASLYLPISPYTSLDLPEPPYISLYLARSPCISLDLPACSNPLAQAFGQFGAGRAIDLAPLCGDGADAAESLQLVLEWLYRGEVLVE